MEKINIVDFKTIWHDLNWLWMFFREETFIEWAFNTQLAIVSNTVL